MTKQINQLTENETAVLRLVGRYRVVFPEAVQSLLDFKDLAEAKAALESLKKKGLIDRHDKDNALAKNVPWFTITNSGCTKISVSKSRSEINGPAALSNHLATLWACCAFNEKHIKRKRIENQSLANVFAKTPSNIIAHVAEEQGERILIWRVYTPKTAIEQLTASCQSMLREMSKQKDMQLAIEQGDYGILVLVEVSSAINTVRQQLARSMKGQQSLYQQARFQVELGPSTSTFASEYEKLHSAK